VSTPAIFLSGMTAMGLFVAALFFLNFWRWTQDRLFLAFGVSFFLLAINQTVIALASFSRDEGAWVYAVRITAFGLLIAAIIGKNVGNDKSGP
jgi:hypothetical protein